MTMPRPRTLTILAAALAALVIAAPRATAPASGQSQTTPTTPTPLTGCVASGDEVRRIGPTDQKAIALTFDDGPSDYTPAVLRILGANHVPGTFFEIGKNMAGHEDVMRQIIASGDEIGDHTWHHIKLTTIPLATARTELLRTQADIKRITGFQTCLYRPPNGVYNKAIKSLGQQLGLLAILWTVDPKDFTMPGTNAIYTALVNGAKPGAILLMHDGGGNRSQTVTALPHVIATLKARGYTFDTVSQLLALQELQRR
jgi:peptidoglycan/xylan/chitin deacetylase (PgdA/CDA1 family)